MYEQINQNKNAYSSYQLSIEKDSGNFKALNNMAGILVNMGKLDQAIKYYKKAIKINPGYQESYNNLGVVYNNLSRYDDAKNIFNKVNFFAI